MASGLKILLGDEIDDGAVFREDFGKSFFEVVDFYAFFKIFDINSAMWLGDVALCGNNMAYVEFGGCVMPP